MSAVPATHSDKPRRNRLSVSVTDEGLAVIKQIALDEFDGNLSLAARRLFAEAVQARQRNGRLR
jgi:hypothetical protein